jgi:riboflavin synthase
MFTGIIEGLGTISSVRSAGQGKRLTVEADFALNRSKVGDSISVNGACLTAVKIEGKRFEVDVSPETLQTTTFGQIKVGERINIERAMHLSDRIDGHLVSGHIDGTGVVKQQESLSNAIIITIGLDVSLSRYMIAKGSVAVDGISLTINTCDLDFFSVSIIPHTAQWSTIGFKKKGDRVNIETDMIAKYVERFMDRQTGGRRKNRPDSPDIDHAYLVKTGFID